MHEHDLRRSSLVTPLTALLGPLQWTNKMPGPSWSIDARHCITGMKLRATAPDSPCAKCYAMRGNFCRPAVIAANQKRLLAWSSLQYWPNMMAQLIHASVSIASPYFRWFSSGDLQEVKMFEDIVTVCSHTPSVFHWLPTQERAFVNYDLIPNNLVVRISGTTIDGVAPEAPHSAVVASRSKKRFWVERVARNTASRFYCKAPLQGNQCGECRACWDPGIKTIIYLQH